MANTMKVKRHSKFAVSKEFEDHRNQPDDLRNSTTTEAPTLDSFIISDDVYEFATNYRVPAGRYLSEIMRLEPRVKGGKRILDVCYDLYGRRYEDYYHIRESYPEDSKAMRQFQRALIAAGIKPGPNMAQAVGVLEMITFDYPPKSDFGYIAEREYYEDDTEEVSDEKQEEK